MKKQPLAVIAVLVVALLLFRSSDGGAPLADGSFLLYQQGESTVRLTFHLEDAGDYRTVVEFSYEGEAPEVSEYMEGHDEVVNGQMRTASGGVFELGAFGPLWVSPGQLKEGGNAHGSRVSEIKPWNGRDIALVSASVGMGAAFRGEWYYDLVTGFLVGGMKTTAVSGPDQGLRFELVGTNVVGLVVP